MKMIKDRIFLFIFCAFAAFSVQAQHYTKEQLKEIQDGFEARRAKAFELLRGKPLVKEKIIPPIFSDGSDFSRHYSYSLMDYAFKCFWLGEDVAGANDALLENANYYIGYPRAYSDKDSFYWAADELCKMLEYYGTKGTVKPGLIDKKVEERIYLMMFQYSKQQSKIAKAEYKKNRTWDVDESENHHIQRFYAAWHFAKFLQDNSAYRNKKYNDGHVAAEHFKIWNEYIKEWMRERGRKGLFVEMANDSYGLETLKGVYNFYDFGDEELSSLSKNLLDLYWSAWAQEQIASVRGGAKSRVYPYEAAKGKTPFRKMAWYYLGANEINAPYNNLFTLIVSNYRMPLIAMDIALNLSNRGNYAIVQRRQGRAEDGFYTPPNYHLAAEGGLIRYSYCTPDYIAGSFFCEARNYEDWVMISSQNRWAGIVFEGDADARIYAQCKTGKDNRAYNQFWCVQEKGAMIFQKLQDSIQSRGAHEMRLWVSKAGLSNRVEKDGWIFLQSKKSYIAIKCVGTAYQIMQDEKGFWMIGNDKYAPIVVEVSLKENYLDKNDFQNRILNTECEINNSQIAYRSLDNDLLMMPLNYRGLPSVNGKLINLSPQMVMSSPYVQSVFDSGVVKIKKDGQEMIIDFNQ